jgi:hypothetical protein
MHTLKAGLFGLLTFCFWAPTLATANKFADHELQVFAPQEVIVIFRGTVETACGKVELTVVVNTETGEGAMLMSGCISGSTMFPIVKNGIKVTDGASDFANVVLEPFDETVKKEAVDNFKNSPSYKYFLAALSQLIKEKSAKKN